MFCKLIDAVLETLAVFRKAALLWIGLNEAVTVKFFIDGKESEMELAILTDTQKASMTVKYESAAGNPAVVDGAPVWASSNAAILEVTASPDGMSAVARSVGPAGPAQVSVTADADMGEGTKEIVFVQDFEVKAGQAVTGGITVGAPEEQ